jgi:hypothetical protein
MKRTLLIAGSTAFGMLLWFGLRSGSSAPAPLVTSSEPPALPMVQQKLSPYLGVAETPERTTISSRSPSDVMPANPLQSPFPLGNGNEPPVESMQHLLARLETKGSITKEEHQSLLIKFGLEDGNPQKDSEMSASSDFMPTAAALVPARPQLPARPVPSIRYPLALQEISPEVALSPTVKAGLTEIAENFIASVGGEDQTADDPEYRARWRSQQPAADQQFKTLYGTQAWLALQNSTTHDASQSPPEGNPADSPTPVGLTPGP